jgi:mannan polymerase II complex ANP1 subunit
MRIFSKAAMNTTNVPAKVVAKLTFDDPPPPDNGLDRYYILDDVYEASSIIRVLREDMKMEGLLRMMVQQVGLGMEEIQSSM